MLLVLSLPLWFSSCGKFVKSLCSERDSRISLLNINAKLSRAALNDWKRLRLSASMRQQADSWLACSSVSVYCYASVCVCAHGVSVWSICCCVSPRGEGLRERARDKEEEKKDGRKRWKDTREEDCRCVFECVRSTSGGAVCVSLWIPDGARTQQNTLVHLVGSLSHTHTHTWIFYWILPTAGSPEPLPLALLRQDFCSAGTVRWIPTEAWRGLLSLFQLSQLHDWKERGGEQTPALGPSFCQEEGATVSLGLVSKKERKRGRFQIFKHLSVSNLGSTLAYLSKTMNNKIYI